MYNIPVNLQEADSTQGKCIVKEFQKTISLYTLDDAWKENLREMDELRNSVQNASYENKDPLLIYKLESYELFKNMVESMNRKTAAILMRGRLQIAQESAQTAEATATVKQAAPEQHTDMSRYKMQKDDIEAQREVQRRAAEQAGQTSQPKPEPVRAEPKIGRNDPCPCGSGKKYKNCHGKDL